MRLSALIVPLTVPAPSHGAVVPPLTRKVPENWRCVCEVIDQTSVQLVEMLAAPDVNTSRREPDQPPIRLGVEGGSVALVGELPPQPGTIRSDSASKAVALIADHCTSYAPIRHSSATANTRSDSACRCGLAAPRAAARVSHALYAYGSVTIGHRANASGHPDAVPPHPEPFDHPYFIFEPKLDGFRAPANIRGPSLPSSCRVTGTGSKAGRSWRVRCARVGARRGRARSADGTFGPLRFVDQIHDIDHCVGQARGNWDSG